MTRGLKRIARILLSMGRKAKDLLEQAAEWRIETYRRIPANITRREYRAQLRLQRKARVTTLKLHRNLGHPPS